MSAACNILAELNDVSEPPWYRLVRQNGWRRPRLRVHPAKPKIGLRTTHANEMWHRSIAHARSIDRAREMRSLESSGTRPFGVS